MCRQEAAEVLNAKKILVVDDSRLFRELLTTLLRPYCDMLVTAASCEEALEQLDAHPDLDLVLLDMVLGDGEGFDVLQQVNRLPVPRPQVIVNTASPSREDAERAALMGASGYITKPVTLGDIASACVRDRSAGWAWGARAQRPSIGRALVVDPEEQGEHSLVSWEIEDLSLTGALLATQGPVPIGTRLRLELIFPDARTEVSIEVVRNQDPGWLQPGGIGVHFDDPSGETQRTITLALTRLGANVDRESLPLPDEPARPR